MHTLTYIYTSIYQIKQSTLLISYVYIFFFFESEYTEFQKMCLFLSFTRITENIHVHIAYCHCSKDQIENRTPKVLILRFKFILYD